MKERLQKILDNYNLNSSRLAEKLGVQRSGISHIMSGRNKPGFDFLKGILDLFPEIDANWLITGKGTMFKEESGVENDSHEGLISDNNLKSLFDTGTVDKRSDTKHNIVPESAEGEVYKSNHEENYDDEIQSVILLLKNGKFRPYERE
jgi:transcriptional regulator with XRE-family HTH domain